MVWLDRITRVAFFAILLYVFQPQKIIPGAILFLWNGFRNYFVNLYNVENIVF